MTTAQPALFTHKLPVADKPRRCQCCGSENIRRLDDRWCCYRCGEVQTREEKR